MKKLMLLALSMAVSGIVYAHGGGMFNRQYQGNEESWKEMNEIHDVMHSTEIQSSLSDKGVLFELTSSSDSALESIKKRFVDEQEKLEAYFEGVQVTVSSLDNGVKVTLESNDQNTVAKLQRYERSLIFQYLHNIAFEGENGYYGCGRGLRTGMMHGYNNQNGSGPGFMHGFMGHHSYGPGMMFQDDSKVRKSSEK
ncbi:hypothetical protein KJ966_09130 [bacterium]|nr:hypothetical protein [bacterium]